MHTIELKNTHLQVRVAAPGAEYNGTRFDWTGNVSQITCNGQHTFLTQEQPLGSPNPGGFGLHNEFRISGPGGFADTPVGGACVKIGIGLLHKEETGDYDFRAKYPLTPFQIEVDHTDTSACYRISKMECGDVSLAYQKELLLSENHLRIQYSLKNKGIPVDFVEFSHNFLLLDKQSIGPDYSIQFARTPVLNPPPSQFDMRDNCLRFNNVGQDYYLHYGAFTPDLEAAENWWVLSSSANGLSIRCDMDFPSKRVTLYGRRDVICPEVYFEHGLASGETVQWTRDYSFMAE